MSLGSIVVRLSMRTAEFETDAGRAAKVAEKRAKEIDAAFKKAGVAIGVALGAAAAGAATAIKSTIDRMDELSKASQKVGMPTEEFSKLAYAGGLADVSIESLQGALGKLTKSQAAALKSTSEQAKVFAALGIAVTGTDGSLRGSSEVLQEFADRFRDMKGSPEAMAAGFALFGRSFQDLIPLLKDGGDGIRGAGDELERLGGVLTTEAGQAAEQFNDNLTRLQTAAGSLAQQVSAELLPDMLRLTDWAVDFAKDGDNARAIADSIRTSFESLSVASGFLLDRLDGVGKLIEGMTVNFYGLKTAIAGAVSFDTSQLRAAMNLFAEGRSLLSAGAMQAAAGSRAKPAPKPEPTIILTRGNEEQVALREQAEAIKKARAQQEALRKLLGDPEPKSPRTPRPARAGKTDEQKAAEALEAAYGREVEALHEKLYMIENVGEAARLNYELESGALKDLDEPRAKVLRDLQAQAEAAQKLADQQELGKRLTEQVMTAEERAAAAIKEATDLLAAKAISQATLNRIIAENQTPAQQMLADIREEQSLLGMSADELEIYNRLKWAGVDANSAFGQSIVEETKRLQEQRRAMADQISLMDDFRVGAADAIADFVTGTKSMKDAFRDFADDFAARITRMIAERWIEKLFGAQGSSGAGTSGGEWLGGLLGAIFGGGGKGFSVGGYTGPGGVTQPAGIVHRGEVVWSQTDVARAGGVGKVEVMRKGGGGGGQQVNHFHFAAPTDMRTQQQVAARVGFEQRRALARN